VNQAESSSVWLQTQEFMTALYCLQATFIKMGAKENLLEVLWEVAGNEVAATSHYLAEVLRGDEVLKGDDGESTRPNSPAVVNLEEEDDEPDQAKEDTSVVEEQEDTLYRLHCMAHHVELSIDHHIALVSMFLNVAQTTKNKIEYEQKYLRDVNAYIERVMNKIQLREKNQVPDDTQDMTSDESKTTEAPKKRTVAGAVTDDDDPLVKKKAVAATDEQLDELLTRVPQQQPVEDPEQAVDLLLKIVQRHPGSDDRA